MMPIYMPIYEKVISVLFKELTLDELVQLRKEWINSDLEKLFERICSDKLTYP